MSWRDKADVPSRGKSAEAILKRHEAVLGREFRRVANGLDTEDIIEYLETAAGSGEAAFRRLEQFSAVQAATSQITELIERARKMAAEAKAQTEADARAQATRVIQEVEQQAGAVLDETAAGCLASIDLAKSTLSDAIEEVLQKSREAVEARIHETRATVQAAVKGFRERPTADGEPGGEPCSEEVADAPSDEGRGDSTRQYSGQVALEIPRDADVLWVRQLRQRILALAGAYVEAEHDGKHDGPTVMLVMLKEPTPLLQTLETLPRVARVVDASPAGQDSAGSRGSVECVLRVEFVPDLSA